ncbi:hypothetical protein IJT93_00690 [bacterium]|nr:hypothetical protein [bacterium]
MFSVCLFSEDELFNSMLCRALQGRGVRAAVSGCDSASLKKHLFQKSYTLVLWDLACRGLSQLRLLEESGRKYPRRRNLVLTASTSPGELKHKFQHIDFCILKPCRISYVVNKIIYFLTLQKLRNMAEGMYNRLFKAKIGNLCAEASAWLQRKGLISVPADRASGLRLTVTEKAYRYFQSPQCCRSQALALWKRIEYLERFYLLQRGGCSVDMQSLAVWYELLDAQLDCGLRAAPMYVGRGYKYASPLNETDFSQFYFGVRSGRICQEDFAHAAEARLTAESGTDTGRERELCMDRYALARFQAENRVLAELAPPHRQLYRRLWKGCSS